MTRVLARTVLHRLRGLDPVTDAAEVARLSLVTLHGRPRLVHALFTVAFLQQVAVPAMARTLHRRGTGDVVRDTLRRDDDTIVFFGQLLDHGPDPPTGRAWIDRLNEIHSRFPIRSADSVYTLATLACGPHDLTAALGASPFTPAEREAHWWFWRRVAEHQHLEAVPDDVEELRAWARAYEEREYAASDDGRAVARALVTAFGQRCLPPGLRRWDAHVIATLCPPHLRRVHDLPDPGPLLAAATRAALTAYRLTLPLHPVPEDRSLVRDFGTARYGDRPLEAVGHQR